MDDITINPNHTLYAIYLYINKQEMIQIGKLGTFDFPKGVYIYVGSAKRNIKSRIKRHMQKEKKLRWHFDYLRRYGTVLNVETFDDSLSECERSQQIKTKVDGEFLVKGFGSSDCKCISHLIFIEKHKFNVQKTLV